MDTEWSNKNKKMKTLIAKEATFADGIKVLLELRAELFEQITSIVKTFPSGILSDAFWYGEGDAAHDTGLVALAHFPH